jgi:two-component system CheB/CheR fusion protein
LELRVRVFIQNKWAGVAVSDNGHGFISDDAEKIFVAYKYLKGELPGSKHGSGMGLYISRKLAKKMGGMLEASSQGMGKGAEFRLYLPLVKTHKNPD